MSKTLRLNFNTTVQQNFTINLDCKHQITLHPLIIYIKQQNVPFSRRTARNIVLMLFQTLSSSWTSPLCSEYLTNGSSSPLGPTIRSRPPAWLHLPALSRSRRGHVTGNLRTLAPQTETRPHLIKCRAKRQLLPQTACDPMCSQGRGQYLLPVMISSNWTIENRQVYQHPLKLMGNKQNK